MDIAERQPKVKAMASSLRPMQARDLPQMPEMERDSFPTMWPATPFKRELNSPLARYLITWQRQDVEDSPPPPPPESDPKLPFISRLFSSVRKPWATRDRPEEATDFLTGYVGVWFVIDEAHITAIGVREAYRGRGIGELLLIGAIELAMARSSKVVTLEVRVSNHVAQSLYHKYGFSQSGLRKRYYTDNGEDAFIMTTSPILDPPYPETFQKLVQAHKEHWGETIRTLP